jgi:hypothetical protein
LRRWTNEPWGNGYKIAVGKLKRIENVEHFTEEELQTAAQKLRSGKAPGPDGIPPEAVKAAVKAVPEVVLNAMNATLKEGVFPKIWKRAKLVLIPKGTDEEGPDRSSGQSAYWTPCANCLSIWSGRD